MKFLKLKNFFFVFRNISAGVGAGGSALAPFDASRPFPHSSSIRPDGVGRFFEKFEKVKIFELGPQVDVTTLLQQVRASPRSIRRFFENLIFSVGTLKFFKVWFHDDP